MTLKQVFEIIAAILETMRHGEIRLFVKNGKITHVNRTDEVYYRDISQKF